MAKPRVLVVGVGSIGERHLRCFQATGRVELSVCETNADLRRAVADRYGVERRYTRLDEALQDRATPHTAAVIATPAPFHIPMATGVVREGWHVLIEKPLSTGPEGIRELEDLAGLQKRVAMVGYTYRSHPALREMRRAIAEGRFGRPVQVVSVWGQHFPKYRPAYREIYYARREMGGGAIQDVLPHALNACEFLVGPIDRVLADAAHLVLKGVEVEDTVHAIARHGPVLGCYSLNQHQAPNENAITVICERGTARFELQRSRWLSMTEPGGEWREESVFSLDRDAIFVNQAGIFLDAIEGKAIPPCTIAEGLQTLRAVKAILAASDAPRWQEVRP